MAVPGRRSTPLKPTSTPLPYGIVEFRLSTACNEHVGTFACERRRK
jgi:hypothetical protein